VMVMVMVVVMVVNLVVVVVVEAGRVALWYKHVPYGWYKQCSIWVVQVLSRCHERDTIEIQK
jgi:hypothetical protein